MDKAKIVITGEKLQEVGYRVFLLTNALNFGINNKYADNNYAGYNPTLKVTDNTGLTNTTAIKFPVWIAGDANGDKTVNILDAAKVGIAWGKKYGEPNYDDGADLNNDDKVSILDMAIVGLNWNQKI